MCMGDGRCCDLDRSAFHGWGRVWAKAAVSRGKYELVGDYYLIDGEDELESRPAGIWGQRHLRYLKQYHKVHYYDLLTSGNQNAVGIENEQYPQRHYGNCFQ